MNVRIHKGKKRSVIAHVGDSGNGFTVQQHFERRDMVSHRRLPLTDTRATLTHPHR